MFPQKNFPLAFLLLAALHTTLPAQPPSGWGDGSAGNLVISIPTDWVANPAPANLQFTDITITSKLTLPGGMTLRATGQINIALGGSIVVAPPTATSPVAYPGIASTLAYKSIPGEPVALSAAYSLLRPPAIAGGSGAGGYNPVDQEVYFRGGSGGGSIVLRAGSSFTCYGTILAKGGDGADGGAGGGGGLIIIASKGPIGGKPIYKAPGGAGSFGHWGSFPNEFDYIGGGGGGGIVILAGPNASSAGVSAPQAGPAGQIGFSAGQLKQVAGGGSGGKGGVGNVTPAANGFVIAIAVPDPAYLFL